MTWFFNAIANVASCFFRRFCLTDDPGCISVSGMDLPLDNESPCWSEQTQRDQTYFPRPSISARMRKRRAFADKELENVMLEKELRQRELPNEFTYPAFGPAVAPVPLPVSPNLDCCGINRDPLMSGYVSLYKYKPLYECDFHFYQLFHLKSCSSAERINFHQSLEESRQDAVQNICNISDKALSLPTPQEKHRANSLSGLEAVKPTLMDSSGSSANPCSASGSAWVLIGGQDISESNGTSGLRSVKTWCSDSHVDPAGTGDGSGGSPHADPVGPPAAKPLPFSVEALLKAWQAHGNDVHFASCQINVPFLKGCCRWLFEVNLYIYKKNKATVLHFLSKHSIFY